jgi:tellurium resistance protein TerD
MGVSLTKGGNINLSKEAPGLKNVLLGMGWDPRATDGAEFDLDASAFLLGANDKVRKDDDFIFYKNLRASDGSVEHTGDNRTGAGEGDDEAIKVDLSKVPVDVQKIAFTVTIHDAAARKQNFGQVSNAFIRVVDQANNREVTRYDLTEDASTNTAVIFGELYRNGADWKFRAVGQGYDGGLAAMCAHYGINVG